ncbi:MAG: hypothetical protein ABI832_15375 [bacterium]
MTVITLFPGDDTYTASTAGDIIRGVGGNDTLTASAGGNQLEGGEGDDVLNGGAGNDTLSGDDQTNYTSHNIMKGFGGDDVISSLSWYDQIDAGAGNDTVSSYAQTSGQLVDGGKGDDLISMQSLRNVNDPVHAVMGSTMTFTIGGVNGAIYTNFERLYAVLGIGANTIDGGDGNDTIFTAYLNGTNATTFFDAGYIRSGAGDDDVAFNGITAVGSGIQRMDGGLDTDRLSWTAGDATIGDLEIDSNKGTMLADGRKFATFQNFETFSSRTFTDITGTFTYTGSSIIDQVYVGAAASIVAGGGGNDSLEIQNGDATVSGGSGDDILRASNPNFGHVIFDGDNGNDSLFGGSGTGDFYGDAGNDSISVYNSHSRIYGGAGDDDLFLTLASSSTGSGTAAVYGGGGVDWLTLTLFPVTTAIVLDLSKPMITLDDGTIIAGVEGIYLTSGQGADDLIASNAVEGVLLNKLSGMSGNDTLHAGSHGAWLDGGFGLDVLMGAGGDDLLNGGFGADNDVLVGGGGNDTLIGLIGRDDLTGGHGADVFTLTAYYESGTTDTTRDLIEDFSRKQGDKVDLSGVDAISGGPDNEAFVFRGALGFDHHAGQLIFEKVNLAGKAHDYTLISGDITGDGLANFTIEVKGLIAFHEADFVL